MGKSLMIASTTTVAGNNNRFNLFGLDGFAPITEAHTQANASEAMTLSGLKAYAVAFPGTTATTISRVGGANGNQTITHTATGFQEDTTHTDVLAANDDFNFLHTASGGSPQYSYFAGNVEFTSGHGGLIGAANFGGTTFDISGGTRYFLPSGATFADGVASETGHGFRNRGWTSIETFQVYVIANARVNDTTIRTRVNAADGGLSIVIGAGVTGLLAASGTPDTLADADVWNYSITTGAGVEDLDIAFILATVKSSSGKSDTIFASLTAARAASATEHFLPIGGRQTTFVSAPYTEAQARIKVGFAATVSNPRVYLSANTYGADATVTVYKNGVSSMTFALTASGGAGWYENTADTFDIDDNDEVSIGVVGGTSGSATFLQGGLTFSPIAAVGSTPTLMMLGIGS